MSAKFEEIHAKPLAAKTTPEHIDPSIVASSKAALATTGARLLVRISFFHRGKHNESGNGILPIDTKDRCQILTESCGAVIEPAERQTVMFLEV